MICQADNSHEMLILIFSGKTIRMSSATLIVLVNLKIKFQA